MKTKVQIKAYLQRVKPKREIDELAIRQYCSDCGMTVPVFDGLSKGTNLTLITFADFKDWIGDNSPSSGEVIVLDTDGSIGLVRNSGYDSITFHALSATSGELQLSNLSRSRSSYRPATDIEQMKLQKALATQHLDYNRHKDMLVDKLLITEGKYARITLLGHKVGIGIFRQIDAEGSIVMYVFQNVNGKPLLLNGNIGPSTDYQIEMVSYQEREAINEILDRSGYLWNGYSKYVEPKELRRTKGASYFYINNYLEIVSVIDGGTKQDSTRFHALNYYTLRKDAEKILATLPKNRLEKRNKVRLDYYFINNYLSVVKAADLRRRRDNKLFEVGNYFSDELGAKQYLETYIGFRKASLLKPFQESLTDQ